MGIAKKLEDIFAATAFAEAGEFEKAREMLKEPKAPEADGKKGRAAYPDMRLASEED